MSNIKRQNVILEKIEQDDVRDKAFEEHTAHEFYDVLDQIDDIEDEADLKIQSIDRSIIIKRKSSRARIKPQKPSVPVWASLSLAAMSHRSIEEQFFSFRKHV